MGGMIGRKGITGIHAQSLMVKNLSVCYSEVGGGGMMMAIAMGTVMASCVGVPIDGSSHVGFVRAISRNIFYGPKFHGYFIFWSINT